MAVEKENSTLVQEKAELDKKVADDKEAVAGENLSQDELNAVSGGFADHQDHGRKKKRRHFDCTPRLDYNG